MDLELIDEAGPNAMKLTGLERSPMLWSFCGARRFGLEVSSFHVASTRFWEAVLLPCAVVVVVAFSSCMELWVGQCVSLACWYAVNYYAMGYTLQVLHPQNASGLLWLSPFGGTLQLALWSVSLALLEVVLLHTTSRTLAQTVGTVLYATCGCLWLHLWIAPWRWLPEGWRPHSWVFRRREDREKRQGSSPTEETESPRRRPDSRRSEEGSLAGHAALAIAGYALLITFQQAFPSPTRRPSSGPPHDGPSSRPSRPPDPRRPTAPLSPFQVKKWSPSPNSTRSRWSRTKVFPRTYVGDRSRPSTQAPVAFGPGHASASRNSSLDQDAGTANSVARANATWTGTPETRRLNQAGGSGGGNGDRLTLPSVSTDGDSEAADKATSRFQALDALIPLGACVMLLLMMLDSGKSLEFSIPHLVCYNLLCLRIPDVLGHWVVTTVTRLQMAPSTTTTAISFAYMGAMQGYLMALKWVCRHMSAPDMFPRFQFVAQMYYYLFWYMMLMVLSPGGVEDRNFWMLVFFLNGVSLASNAGLLNVTRGVLWPGSVVPDPPLKVLFDSKLAVQDQLADVVSLLVVPAIASSFHLCTSLRVPSYPIRPLLSLWQRFLVLLLARLLSGLLTEEIFRRRVDVLNKAEALELQLLPIDGSQNRTRYLSDICIGPKLALEAMRNIERCELYFATVAVVCTFSVFQKGDWPTRCRLVVGGACFTGSLEDL